MSLSIWELRRDALFAQIDHTTARLKDKSNPDLKALYDMSLCLSAFADYHFKFIDDGLKGDGYTFEKDHQHPDDFIYANFLERVALDISAIQQAYMQRGNGVLAMSEVKNTLKTADRLAARALAMISDSTTVLTFMEEALYIRVIPYTDVALIGIPYTCMKARRDILAIPHEVGHYVYWKLHALRQRIFDRLITYFNTASCVFVQHWTEEIFADVYGCIVAGPVLGIDMMERALQNTSIDFIKDDRVHPTPIIRPNVYSAALKHMGYSTQAAQIAQQWQEMSRSMRANSRKDQVDKDVIKLVDGSDPDLADCLTVVDEVVKIMVEEIKAELSPQLLPRPLTEGWQPDLLEVFEATIDQSSEAFPNPIPKAIDTSLVNNQPSFWKQALNHLGIPELTRELNMKTWQKIVRAGQWMNKGPGNPTPPTPPWGNNPD